MSKFILSTALAFALLFSFTAGASADGDITSVDISVSAKSAVLIEGSSDSVIYEKNSRERRPMASTTKIMTALVALESCPPDRKVTIPHEACGIEGSSVYLREGEVFTMEELLYALLLSSANDAATAIALEVGGDIDSFADMMNEKAEQIGLCDTHFTNPHGLDDEEHYTSAYDLAVLSAHALENGDFRRIVSTYRQTIGEGESTRHLLNHNRLLKLYDDALGVKTGYTKTSGRCLVSAAERDGVRLVAVTLSDPDDWKDHTRLLDYGFSCYSSVELCGEGEITLTLPCTGGDADTVTLRSREALTVPLPNGHGEITRRIDAPHMLFATVNAGDAIGEAVFLCDGREIGRTALYAENSSVFIEKKGFFERLLELYR